MRKVFSPSNLLLFALIGFERAKPPIFPNFRHQKETSYEKNPTFPPLQWVGFGGTKNVFINLAIKTHGPAATGPLPQRCTSRWQPCRGGRTAKKVGVCFPIHLFSVGAPRGERRGAFLPLCMMDGVGTAESRWRKKRVSPLPHPKLRREKKWQQTAAKA